MLKANCLKLREKIIIIIIIIIVIAAAAIPHVPMYAPAEVPTGDATANVFMDVCMTYWMML